MYPPSQKLGDKLPKKPEKIEVPFSLAFTASLTSFGHLEMEPPHREEFGFGLADFLVSNASQKLANRRLAGDASDGRI